VDPRRRRTASVLYGVALLAYGLDRVTKLWAESFLPGNPIDLIPGAVSLRFTTNSGGAFSIGRSAPWLFVGVSVMVAAVIVATSTRHTTTAPAVALGAILGGALGNLTDRASRGPGFRGEVVDFIDLHVWPIFNLADTAIVFGAILLAWTGLRDRQDEREPAATAEPPTPP
jgi:signal peptidase II